METQQNPSPPFRPSAAVSTTNGAVGRDAAAAAAATAMGEGALYVQVMTDEQMEVLRRQISVYATICEQLVEMHKAVTAHNDSIGGNLFLKEQFLVSGFLSELVFLGEIWSFEVTLGYRFSLIRQK